MKKDVDVIVEIDEGEAEALIELIELLFREWYVEREDRKRRTKHVIDIAEAKRSNVEATPEDVVPEE
jgi:hypothetical protein